MIEAINKHIDEVERLENIAVENAENIFKQIDLDKLLENPRIYLNDLIGAFVNDHLDEIELAKEEGLRFGKAIIKEAKNGPK